MLPGPEFKYLFKKINPTFSYLKNNMVDLILPYKYTKQQSQHPTRAT